MLNSAPRFKLAFNEGEIRHWAARNRDEKYKKALAAGKRLSGGRYNRRDFDDIIEWKAPGRIRHLIKQNTDGEIADALELAVAAKKERSSVAVLTGLSGVSVPVASALLAMLRPSRATIIDYRALRSVGCSRASTSVNIPLYLQYVRFCRKVARAAGVDLRTLDRALWQYDKERHPSD